MAVNPIPEGYRTVTPYLVVDGATNVLDFVKQAFGAEEKLRMDGPDGKIGHAEVQIGDSIVMMGDAGAENPAMPAMIHLYVDDCDASPRTSSTGTGRQVFVIRRATCGGSPRTSRTCPRRRWRSESKRPRPRRPAERERRAVS